jgi:Fur family ferric uptake transcriptional regulator
MICTKCRKIIEFEDSQLEQLQLEIAKAKGFHLLQHKMELYGLCRQCRDTRELLYPLDAAKRGERVVIRDFVGGATARLRLLTMGLRIDDEIEVVTNLSPGQIVVAVDYKRLVIGHGLARKIVVSPVVKAGGA